MKKCQSGRLLVPNVASVLLFSFLIYFSHYFRVALLLWLLLSSLLLLLWWTWVFRVLAHSWNETPSIRCRSMFFRLLFHGNRRLGRYHFLIIQSQKIQKQINIQIIIQIIINNPNQKKMIVHSQPVGIVVTQRHGVCQWASPLPVARCRWRRPIAPSPGPPANMTRKISDATFQHILSLLLLLFLTRPLWCASSGRRNQSNWWNAMDNVDQILAADNVAVTTFRKLISRLENSWKTCRKHSTALPATLSPSRDLIFQFYQYDIRSEANRNREPETMLNSNFHKFKSRFSIVGKSLDKFQKIVTCVEHQWQFLPFIYININIYIYVRVYMFVFLNLIQSNCVVIHPEKMRRNTKKWINK